MFENVSVSSIDKYQKFLIFIAVAIAQKLRVRWMDKYTSTRNTKSNTTINEESDKVSDREREEEED